uniref:JMJ903 n=1 Tax=Arundo donax TaxID=35708 RepID=A0A0A8ZK32_ARUDO
MSLAYSTATGRSAEARQKSASTSSGESCLEAGTLRRARSALREAPALASNCGSV